MKVNKTLLFAGIIVALIAAGAMFYLGQVINPAPTIIIAAAEDIPAGTKLSELSVSSLAQIPMTGDALLLGALVTPEQFEAMKAVGGEFVEGMTQYEPLRLSAIASAANPAGANISSLSNADPNMIITRINLDNQAPTGIRAGDRIDLVVAISEIDFDESYYTALANALQLAAEEKEEEKASNSNPVETVNETDTETETETENEEVTGFVPDSMTDGEAETAGAAIPVIADPLINGKIMEDEVSPYYFQAPMAKTIVQNGVVTKVVFETKTSMTSAEGATEYDTNEIIAIEVMIPRDALEWVTMANASGDLAIGLLSPLADDSVAPTIGATLQDLIEQFYSDRGLEVGESLDTEPTVEE